MESIAVNRRADPAPLDQRTVLIFLHIPKTAGSTLKTFFRRHTDNYYEINSYTQWQALHELAEAGRLEAQARIIVSGHLCHGVEALFGDRECAYITILRNPVERLLSHYRYDVLKRRIDPACVSLTDFARQRGTRILTRMLSMDGDHEQACRFLRDRAVLFGLQERYRDFLAGVAALLGVEEIEVTNKNISRHFDIPVPDDEIERAGQMLADDLHLYEYAAGLYEQRHADVLAALDRRVIETDTPQSRTRVFSTDAGAAPTTGTELHHIALAEAHLQQGDLAAAEAAYQQAAQLENRNFEPLLQFYERHDRDRYIECFLERFVDMPRLRTTGPSLLNRYIDGHLERFRRALEALRAERPDAPLLSRADAFLGRMS